MDWQREVVIPRVTPENVNKRVDDHEERLRAIEIKLGLRDEEENDDE